MSSKNVYIYLRKSRKDLEEEKKAAEVGQVYDTLERHRKQLLNLARIQNYNIIEILEEIVSGEYIVDRPVMQQLLRKLDSQKVYAVLVMDLDRLGRGDMFDQGIIDRAFRFSETKIVTPSEQYDPQSETWELVFGIKSLFAREELKATSKRLIRGRRQSATEGKHIANKPPYGYKRNEKLKLTPDPEKAWIIQKIFELTVSGWGRQRIALELQRLGVKSPRGNDTWGEATIRQIISNEVYTGKIIWGKQKNIKVDGKYIIKKLPKEEWVIIDDAHEPIISEDLFNKVHECIKYRYNPSLPQNTELKNALAGLLKCDLCGNTMKYTKPPKRPNAYMHCQNVSCKGKQRTAVYKLVEEKILNGLEHIVDDFKLKEEMFEKKKETSSVIFIKEKALENKINELNELNKQKNKLHDFLERGVYDIDTFMGRQAILVDRVKKVEAELSLINEELDKEKERNKNYSEYIPAISAVIEAYKKTNDITKKNRLLKSVLEKATFRRDDSHKKKDEFIIQLYLKL